MKKSSLAGALASIAMIGALTLAVPAFGQAEKVKQKAKELKKNVEGGPTQTNKPPPSQKPAK